MTVHPRSPGKQGSQGKVALDVKTTARECVGKGGGRGSGDVYQQSRIQAV